MKLYVVMYYHSECNRLVGVFSTLEKAEEIRAKDSQHNAIEEVELDKEVN